MSSSASRCAALAYRERRGRQIAYDEVVQSEIEALARAIQRLARGEEPAMTSQERQRLITGWMRERMEQGYSALVAHSYALHQLGMLENRQIQAEAERSRQEQRKARDISGFPDDDWFLQALANICFSCDKQETSAHELYQWPESGAFPRLYCWDCWEHVSGKTLGRSRKPSRKEIVE